MLLVEPDQDHIISTAKLISVIDMHAEEIALILLPGVQYYSGQLFDVARITQHAHSRGLLIGWDLAHAAGNVPLRLHDWDVDFAAWCTYKYMNAGPGSIAGLFVHERHGKVEYANGSGEPVFRHRLTGWYGGDRASRFQMDNSKSLGRVACGFRSKDTDVSRVRQSSDPSLEREASRSPIRRRLI
jgi:kynureninase